MLMGQTMSILTQVTHLITPRVSPGNLTIMCPQGVGPISALGGCIYGTSPGSTQNGALLCRIFSGRPMAGRDAKLSGPQAPRAAVFWFLPHLRVSIDRRLHVTVKNVTVIEPPGSTHPAVTLRLEPRVHLMDMGTTT